MCGFIWNARDLLQQWGKRKGDQPAHVERHGCSLMWLQLGSPGPNEVLWSSAAPSPIVYPAAAHILPPMHHSGSLRRCSQIPPGTLKEKHKKKEKACPEDWHTGVWVRTPLQFANRPTLLPAHTIIYTQTHLWPTVCSSPSICLSVERCSCGMVPPLQCLL